MLQQYQRMRSISLTLEVCLSRVIKLERMIKVKNREIATAHVQYIKPTDGTGEIYTYVVPYKIRNSALIFLSTNKYEQVGKMRYGNKPISTFVCGGCTEDCPGFCDKIKEFCGKHDLYYKCDCCGEKKYQYKDMVGLYAGHELVILSCTKCEGVIESFPCVNHETCHGWVHIYDLSDKDKVGNICNDCIADEYEQY